MAKRVLFRLMGGDCETGFSVAVEVFRESDSRLIADVEGKLPPVQNILENYQNWQENYRSLVNGRDSSPRLSVEAATYSEILTKIANAKIQLDSSVNSWFHPQEPFLPVWTTLLQSLTKHEEIRVVLKTSNTQLQQLPLFLWKAFFDHYYRAELSLCLPVSDSDISPIPRDKVKVLAIFGKKQITETTTPINTEEDWNQLKKLLSQESNAELIKLKEPSLEELSQEIIKQEPQILFFAGHSSSHNEQGLIYLNQKEKITISFLRNVLIKAVKNSLQLAIFNSCDGIAIAQQLSETRIPNIIVMRESIPDLVAQKFLQRFLEAFAAGKSLNLAVRRAREKIGFLELQYPGATLLPMLWENPSTPPLTWKSLGGIETKRKQARNIPYNP
ncbi:MAG: CHAT domain-containing protein, partial [Oscillatoria sp. PMC 1076.18]|nr:CHAT domain-containing protein [Oscillatoria sp. PMC 1076.18]